MVKIKRFYKNTGAEVSRRVFIIRMNEEQQLALKLPLEGHNCFLTGPAGTGKSFVLGEITRNLRSLGKTVYLTSTTGISCTNFPKSLVAMTIHRWSGIEDGHTSSELTEMIKFSPHFSSTLNRIKNTEVLIIDEISMLSAKNFNLLKEICRGVRCTEKGFGGLKLIMSGDFCQLPPVPNSIYDDDGDFCFISKTYTELIKHKVMLSKFVRQTDEGRINAIKKVSCGTVDDELIKYMKELERPLNQQDSTKLFANNFLVDNYNRRKVIEWEGDLYEYKAVDSGDRKYLHKIKAPSTLWLKRGVPVILLRNLSNDLVNGLRGTIVGFEEEGPVIEFEGGVTTLVKKTVFSGRGCYWYVFR